ncbi:MAG TPA: chemotaxis protein CheW [Archangium sp.]|uniref:chemotaxis protein CheW n=1 Tax=Archangium sp. TaxID=1872627 RepID=UPI002E303284|nr:chemotaxis protein CheW [Archangium sp.]HEX5751313.1 chemotaxis protein CheW [Archangium sp.]
MSTGTEDVFTSQYMGFRLGDEDYAVHILRVKEIIAYSPVTPVPGLPPVVLGVINLRGKVVPVVDLAMKFGLPARRVTKWSCIVIVESELEGQRTEVGILTDAVSQVLDLAPRDIEPPPAFGTRVRVDYLEGLGRREGGFVLLLNLDRLLSTSELLAVSRATEEQAA